MRGGGTMSAYSCGEAGDRCVLIEVKGGLVQEVYGLPEGWTYDIRDYDVCSECGDFPPRCVECQGERAHDEATRKSGGTTKPKKLSVEMTDWFVSGVAFVTDWYGNSGFIPMRPERIPLGELTKAALFEAVNDNGFGVQSIDAAYIEISEYYERGVIAATRDLYAEFEGGRWVRKDMPESRQEMVWRCYD